MPVQEDTLALFSISLKQEKVSHVKGAPPTPTLGGYKDTLSPKIGNLGWEACVNNSCYYFNLLPQAQILFVSLVAQMAKNLPAI